MHDTGALMSDEDLKKNVQCACTIVRVCVCVCGGGFKSQVMQHSLYSFFRHPPKQPNEHNQRHFTRIQVNSFL